MVYAIQRLSDGLFLTSRRSRWVLGKEIKERKWGKSPQLWNSKNHLSQVDTGLPDSKFRVVTFELIEVKDD